MSHANSTVNVTVMIANKEITWPLMSVELSQASFDHHEAAVTVATDIEAIEEEKRFLSLSEYQDALGKSLTVKIEPADEYVSSSEKLEFVGVVTNISFENDVDQINRVTFHAKSPTWLMDRSKTNKFWEDSDLSGIVNGIVGNYNIEKGEFKPTSGQHHFVVQFGETDWAFVSRLCSRDSKWLYYDGSKLVIDVAKSKNTHNLSWVKHIGAFDLKMNVKNLETRSDVYYEGNKQDFFTDSTKGASSTDFSSLTRQAHSVSKSNLKDKSFEPFPQHTDTEDKAVKYLVAKKQSEVGQLVTCMVQSNVPSIKIGDTVKVEGMKDFSGTYFVTEVKHTVAEGNSYSNEFAAVPLETAHPSWKAPATKIPQMQAAVVTDNKDPDSRYRVRVKLNYTDAESAQLETPFLRVITPHAGGSYGNYFLPDIGDEVLVGFERDNPEVPVVIGNLWNGQVKPESGLVNDSNNYKAIYTRGGNRIDIGDEGGKEFVKITNSDKNTIFLECDGPKITIHTEGDLEIDAKKNITMKAGEDFKIEAKGNFSMDTKKAASFSSSQKTSMEAKADFSVKGMNVKTNANANLESKAGGQHKTNGAMVDINGSSMVNVKGAIINLN
jgi:type VI secretion system secreted protein VgrG